LGVGIDGWFGKTGGVLEIAREWVTVMWYRAMKRRKVSKQ
jgi:hypothetical protein